MDRSGVLSHGTRPAVFLDRDGTLVEDVPYLADPARVRLLPGTAEAVRLLREAGFACVVATNQSAVGRGIITLEQLALIHQEMERQLAEAGTALDGIYSCAHLPALDDPTVIEHVDRKPGPGMLLRAARDLNLDLAASWIVGDRLSDMLAGKNAGCRGGVLVRRGLDTTDALEILGADWPVADDLSAAATLIINRLHSARPGAGAAP
ncbi:MAG: HAD family hydrolase [Gemmataceae bacterium]|nr:HAD family hydrolase [Gemmataceae bacterium]